MDSATQRYEEETPTSEFKIFTRSSEPTKDSIEEVQEELEMLWGAMCSDDEFVILKDDLPYAYGDFIKESIKIKQFALHEKCKLSVDGKCKGNFSPLDCNGIDTPEECKEMLDADHEVKEMEVKDGK